MTKCSKKVSMKWTSLLAQGWTKIPGAQQQRRKRMIYEVITVFIILDAIHTVSLKKLD